MEKIQGKQAMAGIVLMVRPFKFRCNEQTAVNNFYQKKSISESRRQKEQQNALQQFDLMVQTLQNEGVKVLVVQDSGQFDTPDSIFPNNWISFHCHLSYNLYPMFAQNRRKEKHLLDQILSQIMLHCLEERKLQFDYSIFQKEGLFLQGTGSIVLDRANRIAYSAISPRTNQSLFYKFCTNNSYQPVAFKAYQSINKERELIYHTNVMISIGREFVSICLDSIDDAKERQLVFNKLVSSKKDVILLTEEQIAQFAGNMLALIAKQQTIIVISSRGFNSLTEEQIQRLQKYGKIVPIPLETIQTNGGGSARCMIAEIF